MRRIILIILFCLSGTVLAQDDDFTGYEIALQRILEAEASGATRLGLADINLENLPPEIGNLTSLESLYLSDNQLIVLPPEISNLTSLRQLSLRNNKLESIPPEIGNLTNLLSLSLDGNYISSLPPEIGNLINLDTLNLQNNQFTEFPSDVQNLNKLRAFFLSNNLLVNIPEGISNLSNLCLLDLRNNQLKTLPVSLYNLENLTDRSGFCEVPANIMVDGNPLISPPPEVVNQGTEAILDYLHNRARWHLQRLIIGISSGVVFLITLFALLLRYRQRNQRKPKQKRV